MEVEVTHLDIKEHKLSLSMKALETRKDKEEMKKYLDTEDSGLSSSLGDIIKKNTQ